MAIYHLSVKTIGRSEGRSATAAAAYRSGDRIADERTGLSHDYTRRSGVEHTEIFLPDQAPEWAGNREQLWNAAEAAEKRINSTVAREFEVALPAELTREQRRELVREFAGDLVKRHGLAVDVAMHKPGREGDNRNYHAHVLCSTRRLGPEGFTEKSRELDDRKSGEVDHWRKRWAELANKALERTGVEARVDHRSFSALGVEREPTIHQGVHATAMERRVEKARESGKVIYFPLPDRCIKNREIVERNEHVGEISARIIELAEARELMEEETRQREQQRAEELARYIAEGVSRMKARASQWSAEKKAAEIAREKALAQERAAREKALEIEKAVREAERRAEEERKEAERRQNASPHELAEAIREASVGEYQSIPFRAVLEKYPQLSGAVEAREAIAQDPDFRIGCAEENDARLDLATEIIAWFVAKGDLFFEGGNDSRIEGIKEEAIKEYKAELQRQRTIDRGIEL